MAAQTHPTRSLPRATALREMARRSAAVREGVWGSILRRWLGRTVLLAFALLSVVALWREARAMPRYRGVLLAPPIVVGEQGARGTRGSDGTLGTVGTHDGRAGGAALALAADAKEPGLIVQLRLGRRPVHQTPFTLALERPGELVPLIGHSAPDGSAGPLRLPPGLRGRYDITVRAPGFLPARALGVDLGRGVAVVDFSAGGVVPLRAGDLDGDERIDWRDALSWWRLRDGARAGTSADVDGDGDVGLPDLRLLWSNRTHRERSTR